MITDNTVTITGAAARTALLAGAEAVASVVATTMGPAGSTVLIRDSSGKTLATKDGATVAASIKPANPPESMGAQLIKEASQRTADRAGDGTSTCAVIAHAMMKQANSALAAGAPRATLRREFAPACAKLVQEVKKLARPLSDDAELKRVALIASNGDEMLASVVSGAVSSVGAAGKIQIAESDADGVSATITDGVFVRAEMLSGHFANVTGKLACAGDEALIVVSRGKLGSFDAMMSVMRAAAEKRIALVLLFADYEQSAFQALVENRSRGTLNVFACKLSKQTYDEVSDIAAAVGAEPFDADGQVEAVAGKLKRFCADRRSLSVIPADESLPRLVAASLIERISAASDLRERSSLATRAAALASKHAVISVGAHGAAELLEIKHRAEDAVAACRAALEAGVTRGAGAALLDAYAALVTTERMSDHVKEILRAGAEAPLTAILANAGKTLDWFSVARNSAADVFDASSGTMTSTGEIVDCALAPICALENAASAVRTFIASSALVYAAEAEKHQK